MAFNYWWILRYVDAEEHEVLQPYFDDLLLAAKEKITAESMISEWRMDPRSIDGEMRKNTGNLPSVERFAREFKMEEFDKLWDKVTDYSKPTKENTITFTIYPGYSPLSLLFLGLGPQPAENIPGLLGNFLLSQTAVTSWYRDNFSTFLDYIQKKNYKEKLHEHFFGSVCSEDLANERKIEDIFANFLASIEQALASGTGLMSLSIPSR